MRGEQPFLVWPGPVPAARQGAGGPACLRCGGLSCGSLARCLHCHRARWLPLWKSSRVRHSVCLKGASPKHASCLCSHIRPTKRPPPTAPFTQPPVLIACHPPSISGSSTALSGNTSQHYFQVHCDGCPSTGTGLLIYPPLHPAPGSAWHAGAGPCPGTGRMNTCRHSLYRSHSLRETGRRERQPPRQKNVEDRKAG